MNSLSYNNIVSAVCRCSMWPEYKVIMAVKNSTDLDSLYMLIQTAVKLIVKEFKINPQVIKCFYSRHRIYIKFSNGSLITTVLANDNARGHRAHWILTDERIDDNIKNVVLYPMEILKYTFKEE